MNTTELKPEEQTRQAWNALEWAVKYLNADKETQEKIKRILYDQDQEQD